MATVCQTCGDRGFKEALVYCDSCKTEVIHRYCVGIVPVPFTDHITWICEDCDGSDSDSNWLEVDQTAELRQILNKSDGKKKKEESRSHTSSVLAVEDHIQPVKVSSPPVKETMKESKTRDSSASRKSHEVTLVKDGASVLEAEKSYSVSDHSSCSREKNVSGSECKVDETSLLVLAVNDNGLQDATNGELMEESSSPIKETMKESKSQESSDSENPHEFTGLVRNGASVLEVEDCSSGPDHNSCTTGSEGGPDGKEVDQTDKLRQTLKKNEKRKKNSKRSSYHTPPILAVEDHGFLDATNVEPVKVSSSPVKEIMKESKRQERSDSGKPHELAGLINGASALNVENLSSVPGHSSCTSQRKYSGTDHKEVDQTANLKHILKKGEKKEKKQKKTDKEKKKKMKMKNKKSGNHSPPILAVKDHGFQDATNIEPVELSSSSQIKETMESSRQGSSGSRKPHELTGLVRDGTSVSEAEKSYSVSDHSSCTRKKNDSGSECKVDETALAVLPVEDNGLQDATNGEPVEASSSPIKETMKESKSQESSDTDKPHEFTGLVRSGASVLEVEDSSSGPDYNSRTRKDGGPDGKEVDQTDKLRHMSKTNEKGKKNSKKCSNHTLPILAVEDHGLLNATNVEPGKVSSSPVKETMKESKTRERSDSGKPHELTGLVRNEASASDVEKSSSVPGHSSCHRKRNDSSTNHKEVDQTAKLKHILKKGEKKEKKQKQTDKEKKNNKKSSNHSPPVLAVKNHGFQDATNVEPLAVSSSSQIKETMESRRQENSGSRKPHELTGLYGDGTSVLAPDFNYGTTKKRKLSSGNIPLTCVIRQLAVGNSSCKEAEPNNPQMSTGLTSKCYRAQPINIPIWRGFISVKGGRICSIDRIVAHVSSLACPKVHETASSLHSHLSAEMLSRLEIWPNNFLKNGGPKDDSIALFFFPSSESNDQKVFYSLVLEMKKNDLAMRCVLDDAELLLFTSYMLPEDARTFNSNDYLWGVFKRRQTSLH